jgi:hypothetical protein
LLKGCREAGRESRRKDPNCDLESGRSRSEWDSRVDERVGERLKLNVVERMWCVRLKGIRIVILQVPEFELEFCKLEIKFCKFLVLSWSFVSVRNWIAILQVKNEIF